MCSPSASFSPSFVFGYISITALRETSVPFHSLPSSLHKRVLGDLAKAGRPETARHPRKVSDRIQSFISEAERGALGPAVTVGRKVGRKARTHTPNLCGDWMSYRTSRAQCDGLSWFTTSAPTEVEWWPWCCLVLSARRTALLPFSDSGVIWIWCYFYLSS